MSISRHLTKIFGKIRNFSKGRGGRPRNLCRFDLCRFPKHPDAEIPQLMLPNDSEIIIPGESSGFSGEDFLKRVNGEINEKRFWYLLIGIVVGLILASLVTFLVGIRAKKMDRLRSKITRTWDDVMIR